MIDNAQTDRTPFPLYQLELQRNGYVPDEAQAELARQLDELYQRLVTSPPPQGGVFAALRRHRTIEPERGLYIWGDTGRGKTWLVDIFYDALPFDDKVRRHFHRFMDRVHRELASLEGQSDPLEIVADKLAKETRIICFDELFVSDIADAMILGHLFGGLFRRGVTLVATSNTPPDDLYRDGLQRVRFLPAIELLKRHTEVVNINGDNDYRLRALERAPIYHAPLNDDTEESMAQAFGSVAPKATWRTRSLDVKNRVIPTVRRADGVVWFEFRDICDGPRSQTDYIEIARGFNTVLISNIPHFTAEFENQARRFVALIDEFYDRNVKLILSAEVALDDLYAGEKLAFEFKRTTSRLEEMQSHEYLARPHLP
jgi:cell division protein ZapE